jgi:type II secretion system protein H
MNLFPNPLSQERTLRTWCAPCALEPGSERRASLGMGAYSVRAEQCSALRFLGRELSVVALGESVSGRTCSRPGTTSPSPWGEGRGEGGRCRSSILFHPKLAAFTLIELILILALLAIATSLAAPSLSSFFRGRALNSEARQLLSLTHAGQSRAISDGFPMLLWIDRASRAYGLQMESAVQNGDAQDADPKAEEFGLNDNLEIEAVNATALSVNGHSLPAIRFLPDGTVDENSARTVRITAQSGETLWLVQATNRLSYAISDSDR